MMAILLITIHMLMTRMSRDKKANERLFEQLKSGFDFDPVHFVQNNLTGRS